MARKTNVTGIKGLSIGATKNDRGYATTRYTVNYKDGKPKAQSYYFGARQSQKDAFDKEIEFMIEQELIDNNIDYSKIYKKFKHDKLV